MRPGMFRREDVRRSLIYGGGLPVAPFANDLIFANYADREIVLAGADVAGWGDVVGGRDFVQADTTKDPLYSVFATRPALDFDGVNDFMASPVVTLSSRTSITFALTAELDTSGAAGYMLYESSANINSNPGGFYLYNQAPGQCQYAFKNTAPGATAVTFNVASGTHRFIAVMNAGAAATWITRNYLDGVALGTGGLTDRGFGDFAHYIGMRGGVAQPYGGKLGDILMWGRALSVAEIGVADAWLAARCV